MEYDQVKPANPKAEELAGAILNLINKNKKLEEVQFKIPFYGKDSIAEEQEAFNRAADELYEIALKINWKNERVFRL